MAGFFSKKSFIDKPTANIILSGEKLKAFPLRSGTTKMSTLSTLIQDSFGSHNHSNQGRKRKQVQIGKEEVKLSLFRDDMILYIDNPDDATRKWLDFINEMGEVVGYKIYTQKSFVLYTVKMK